MTGLSILRQVYSLMDRPDALAADDGNISGLPLLNQIYGDLWRRECTEPFVPLTHTRQEVELSWRSLSALTYGTAALLSLAEGNEAAYERFLERYTAALPRVQGVPYRRADLWPREGVV